MLTPTTRFHSWGVPYLNKFEQVYSGHHQMSLEGDPRSDVMRGVCHHVTYPMMFWRYSPDSDPPPRGQTDDLPATLFADGKNYSDSFKFECFDQKLRSLTPSEFTNRTKSGLSEAKLLFMMLHTLTRKGTFTLSEIEREHLSPLRTPQKATTSISRSLPLNANANVSKFNILSLVTKSMSRDYIYVCITIKAMLNFDANV